MKQSVSAQTRQPWTGEIRVASGIVQLNGSLDIPRNARGLVLLAHGSGSSRHSPPHRMVAQVLQNAGLATLLIVGGDDDAVIPLNELALEKLHCVKRLEIVPGATHLFEEPGTLDTVAQLAAKWFTEHLSTGGTQP